MNDDLDLGLDLDVAVAIVGEGAMMSDFLVWTLQHGYQAGERTKVGDGFSRLEIVYRGRVTEQDARSAEENLRRLWTRHAKKPYKVRVSFVPSQGQAWQQKYPASGNW
ncbi:hypothetical protein HDA40_007632 [Hamadaea flava]|uniref:Uncharacterized protein n=1 Tax=Hamadaea flava TaxID=1742688 RepID=A0ABV8LXM2_9ACTN|nr:hypothetical protein [Hamadaea flava]MCP2329125.1 hypothetical protein [Hamadaea flava]